MTAFLDTGYVIALEAADDEHHATALRHWHGFVRSEPHLVTTSFVLDEVATFFNSRGRHAKAVEIVERLLGSPSVRLIHVDEELFRDAWTCFRRHTDKRFSLTDCAEFGMRSPSTLTLLRQASTHFPEVTAAPEMVSGIPPPLSPAPRRSSGHGTCRSR